MKERSISVCALVPYPLGIIPSQRFRLEQWQPYLETKGISIDFEPFIDKSLMDTLYRPGHFGVKTAGIGAALVRRVSALTRLRHYDVILIHRAACLVGPALVEGVIALMGLPVVFDFDDAIHVLDTSEANRRFGWLKFPGKTAALCRSSAHVVVGSSYLADYARQFNRRVTIIPSSVDTKTYRPINSRRSNGQVVVGWMGSSTSQAHLEAFAPVLRNLQRGLDFELRVVSDRDPILPGVRFVWRRWSSETEIGELADFDVGIMPMPDDQWSRGKCAMKALLYMSMGVPVICSAVGTNCEVIEHGRNGFLATTPDDWTAQLEELIGNPAERMRLGAAGRVTVEQQYSMERCAARFAAVIEETLESRHPARGYDRCEERVIGSEGPVARN